MMEEMMQQFRFGGMARDWFEMMLIFEGSLLMLMAWMRKDPDITPGDREVIDAHEIIVEGLGNADFVKRIELATGKNIRDQLSVKEILELEREVKLLRMGNDRN